LDSHLLQVPHFVPHLSLQPHLLSHVVPHLVPHLLQPQLAEAALAVAPISSAASASETMILISSLLSLSLL
jgi:hypothetical protein